MQATVGDHIVVESATLGRHARLGEVLAVLGDGGGPPYRVRWDDGSESLYYPGPDAHLGAEDAATEDAATEDAATEDAATEDAATEDTVTEGLA